MFIDCTFITNETFASIILSLLLYKNLIYTTSATSAQPFSLRRHTNLDP